MGYSAYTVECDFVIPPENVEAALAVVNAEFAGDVARFGEHCPSSGFEALVDAVEALSSFEDNEVDEAGGLRLGWHRDSYLSGTDALLELLGPFAVEGSIARFDGEDGSLFGFRVVDGETCEEWGDYVWRLASELPSSPGQDAA